MKRWVIRRILAFFERGVMERLASWYVQHWSREIRGLYLSMLLFVFVLLLILSWKHILLGAVIALTECLFYIVLLHLRPNERWRWDEDDGSSPDPQYPTGNAAERWVRESCRQAVR